MVISSIRNPWDWYVSLWAYGCSNRGRIYIDATRSKLGGALHVLKMSKSNLVIRRNVHMHLIDELKRSPSLWVKRYANADDPEAFKLWLKAIMSDDKTALSQFGYSRLAISKSVGLYSFRAARMAIEEPIWDAVVPHLTSPDELKTFWEEKNLIQRYIRVEYLEDDLSAILNDLGNDVTSAELKTTKINSSKHRHFSEYYDQETVELVNQRDQLVIQKFGYSAPTLGAN